MLRGLLARALVASGRRAERAGRPGRAAGRYRAATHVAPRYAAGHLNLGIVLEAAGDHAAALQAYESALAVAAEDAYACYNVGRLRFWAGEAAVAEQLLRRALSARPDFPDALVMLAHALDAQKRPVEAAVCLESALRRQPDAPGTWYVYGELLCWKLRKLDEAESALRRAVDIDPGLAPAWHLLGDLLRMRADVDGALACYAAARRIAPDRFDLESAQLLTLTLSDAVSADELFRRHRAFGERLEASIPARRKPYAGQPDPHRRLRVGFLSCDFQRHAVSWFMIPLLERLDRAQLELHCYSTGRAEDEVTRQVRERTDGWRDVGALTDEALAQTIEGDAVDVLFDLTGHAGPHRLGVFARAPAPVQVSWLGYLHTTGLTRIGWRITDARADPPGEAERLHTERLARLPHALWCYRPPVSVGHATAPPCVARGHVTFGSFNAVPKLGPAVRRRWVELLAAMPTARLHFAGVSEGRARDHLLRDFAAAGIAADRLTFTARLPEADYFRQFDEVDIALDTFPYGGGTTTLDALWMGVPVLTQAGDRSVGRSAASILGELALDAWVARSPEAYVGLAQACAGDVQALAGLRSALRARLRASAMMDEAGFASEMALLLRALWREWCARAVA